MRDICWSAHDVSHLIGGSLPTLLVVYFVHAVCKANDLEWVNRSARPSSLISCHIDLIFIYKHRLLMVKYNMKVMQGPFLAHMTQRPLPRKK
uniref:Uncharacterized protein n=1 Tax=Arundo donax TaxID=35708 RepID=A0A0A9DPH6_ARUDO